jgi:hypothetical protein
MGTKLFEFDEDVVELLRLKGLTPYKVELAYQKGQPKVVADLHGVSVAVIAALADRWEILRSRRRKQVRVYSMVGNSAISAHLGSEIVIPNGIDSAGRPVRHARVLDDS